MRYAAPWDRTLRISTAALLVVIAAALVFFVRLNPAGALPGPLGALLAAGTAALLLLAWALAPKGFSVEGHCVRVERSLRPVVIPLSEVRAVGFLPDGALRGAARLGGSSGFFGYYGRFWSRRLGAFRAYATRGQGLVRVDTERGLFVLSPEPAGRFVEDVLGRAPGAVRIDPAAALPRHPVPRRTRALVVTSIALVPIALAAMFVSAWAFRPRAASVGDGAVRIERELASPVVIPLADVRGVELLRRVGRLQRVSGFKSMRAAYGHYRSDELGDFQLYAWRRGPYVLLDTATGRVLLTPDAPEEFVAAVRAGITAR